MSNKPTTWVAADGYSYTEFQQLPGSPAGQALRIFYSLCGAPAATDPIQARLETEPETPAEPEETACP